MPKKRSSSSTTNSRKKTTSSSSTSSSTSSAKRPKVTPPADVEEHFEDVEVEDEDQVMAEEEEEDPSHVSPSRKIVIQEAYTMREAKRIFLSDVEDDCLVSKIKIVRVKPNLDIVAKETAIPECNYYYDLNYLVPYSTFRVPTEEVALAAGDSDSSICSEEENENNERKSTELRLLDLYSGCGAMSTGLCLGANLSGINLVTKWAVDINKYACESLKLNHPETEVRNETVDDFLMLLKEWRKLCASYSLIESAETHQVIDAMGADDGDDVDGEDGEEEESNGDEVFEVDQILGICYGKPKPNTKVGLYFQVRWKGYGLEEDTWEPVDGLGNCRESIGKFVKNAFNNKALPLPGDVDVVCGGPPCQGLSGFNRFRNIEKPLDDSKNKQLLVYMDVVDYLKPRFLLMENVVDLFKFSKAFCGRYALGGLVDMNYQVRMGMMAAERIVLQCPNLETIHAAKCVKTLHEVLNTHVNDCATDSNILYKRMADGSKRVRVPYTPFQLPSDDSKQFEPRKRRCIVSTR